MRNLLLAVLVLVAAGVVCGQAPNPFIPKVTQVPASAIADPAPVPAVVIVLHSGAPNTYHVVIDDTVYTATGVGPKVSGIYSSLFQIETVEGVVKQSIILTVNHFNVKPTETFTLTVVSSAVPALTPYTRIAVDGRRLLIYGVTDTPNITIYKALTVDNETGEETRFVATSVSEPLPLGIYDFLITGTTLTVYHQSKSGSVTLLSIVEAQ